MKADDPKYPFDTFFGLPLPPSSRETAAQRLSRKQQVRFDAEIVVGKLFAALETHLGSYEARKLFNSYSEPRRQVKSAGSRGRGAADPVRDAALLDLYDIEAESTSEKGLKSIPRKLAERLINSGSIKFGHSEASAIIVHIRRLLKEREANLAKTLAAQIENDRQLRNLQKTAEKTGRIYRWRARYRNK